MWLYCEYLAYRLTNNSALRVEGLKFVYQYLYSASLRNILTPEPQQQVIKQGPGEPEVEVEAAVIQAQLQQKVMEFPKLCVLLEANPDKAVSGSLNVLGFFYSKDKAATLAVQSSSTMSFLSCKNLHLFSSRIHVNSRTNEASYSCELT